MQNLLRALGDRRIALQDGKQSQKGFTLVELLVVVIIIGILAGIAIPVFLNQRQSAWQAEAESDARNAALAAETYMTTNDGKYTGLDLAKLIEEGFEPSRTAGAPAEGETTPPAYVVAAPTADGDNFTITVNHPDLDAPVVYKSAEGGLQSTD